MADDFVKVADAGDLPPGKLLQVRVNGNALCLANVNGDLYAVDNACPHARWPLSNGALDGDEIVCPGHGMLFNLPNCTLNAHRVKPGDVRRYQVRVTDGAVWVRA